MRRFFEQLICCAALLAWAAPASAQILNIEKNRLEREEGDDFVGNFGATFNYNNRSPTLAEQVRIFSTGINSNLAHFNGNVAYLLINDYQVLEVNDETAVSTGYSHLRIQFQRKGMVQYELYNQYQYDMARGLEARSLLGTSLRVMLVKSEPINVIVGAGPMYEIERWRDPVIQDRTIQAMFLKANSYVSAQIAIDRRVDLNGIIYYQVGHGDDIWRHRISGDVNLAIKMGRLSLTSTLSFLYENEPIVPIIPFVFSTTNGVRVNF